jgi:hypothetical protein
MTLQVGPARSDFATSAAKASAGREPVAIK